MVTWKPRSRHLLASTERTEKPTSMSPASVLAIFFSLLAIGMPIFLVLGVLSLILF